MISSSVPTAAEGPDFLGPNGASLRPAASPTLHEVLCNWRGNCILYKIPAGTPLPAGLTLLHEHSDHYSLQTTKPISLPDLQKAMTAFIAPFKLQQTREEFLETNDFYGS
ncbi:hypothetical protein CAOG_07433 [Capsaspora owczarzaki ATCC 30864]|nr:hypothetical protein CAOG_07433 [Capsaspora owczarzaki ATCC 30864]|eukprot:XP_004343292.1 hypothetical protein CAOG_07433 [Capsaspora owczarzaki ATCC 30864]